MADHSRSRAHRPAPADAPLIPISTFARLTRLTPRALRLYDRNGLLRPAWVDESNGYRYYGPHQLADADAIRLLREFDVPLAAVREALATHEPERWRAILGAQRDDLRRRLRETRRTLARLDATLARRDEPMRAAVELRDEPDRHVVSARAKAGPADLEAVYERCLAAVESRAEALELEPCGREVVIYHVHPRREDAWDLEVALPVDLPDGPAADPSCPPGWCTTLPAATLAVLRHHGSYDDECLSSIALLDWIVAHGHRIVGPERGVYLVDDRDTADVDLWVTEIAFPVGPA